MTPRTPTLPDAPLTPKVHHPHEHHHPDPAETEHAMVRVERDGMAARLPQPGACFFFAPPYADDPPYVTHRLYLTLPRLDRPGRNWWTPNYCWIGDHADCHQWDGNLDAPTITPSILEAKWADDAPLWHGWLRAGVLRPV